MVVDEILPLQKLLMSLLPVKLMLEKPVLCSRQSRVSRVIKNARRILVLHWRIYTTLTNVYVENAKRYVRVAVDNYVGQTDNDMRSPHNFVDFEKSNGSIEKEHC